MNEASWVLTELATASHSLTLCMQFSSGWKWSCCHSITSLNSESTDQNLPLCPLDHAHTPDPHEDVRRTEGPHEDVR